MKTAIAIPDSSLKDESTKLDKSRKISIIARACAIFHVDEIYIYREGSGNKPDVTLLATILKYLETPPYFRKHLYPKTNLLKYAGVLSPLKIPSHSAMSHPRQIKTGDIREAIIVKVKGKKFFDVGINRLIPYFGKEEVGKRTVVRFKNTYPNFTVKEISKNEIAEYWGYSVKERGNLYSFLSSWHGNIIITSRKGKIVSKTDAKWYVESKKPVLVVFGSPEKGIHEILGRNIKKIQNSKVLNFFPNQATETVRLEEALLGTLSILNTMSTDYF